MPAAQIKECQLQRIAVRFEVPYRQGGRPEAELFQKFAVGIGRTGPNIGTTRRERSKNKTPEEAGLCNCGPAHNPNSHQACTWTTWEPISCTMLRVHVRVGCTAKPSPSRNTRHISTAGTDATVTVLVGCCALCLAHLIRPRWAMQWPGAASAARRVRLQLLSRPKQPKMISCTLR